MPQAASRIHVPDPNQAAREFAAQVLKNVDLSNFEIFPTQILVAHHIRKTVGSSGRLIAADKTQKEDRFQGKAGLVLMMGSNAFKDSSDARFFGFSVSIGDWVLYRASDGWDFDYVLPFSTDHVPCRLLLDTDIKARIPRPEVVY